MGMNKVPILILGIGGIGCRIAANVNDLLTDEDRQYVGVVGLDTNVNDLRQLEKRGIRAIQTSDERTVRDFMTEHFFSTSWFPLNRFTAGKSMLNGAGQIRAVSRLAAIAAEEQGKFIPIKEEIQRIRRDSGQLTVMVVGSITGGTGAGLFLQIPYYLRKVMHDASGRSDIVIRGMFVGPDITVDVQPSKINRDAVNVNGYACLKELNALYLRENGMPGIAPLKVDFYEPVSQAEIDLRKNELMEQLRRKAKAEGVDWSMLAQDAAILSTGNPALPYDYLYLIENGYAEGTIGDAELTNVEELVGRMVHTLMLTPVSSNALSVEDNMVLQDMATRGMNRYSSAGICRLVYPMEIAREYVTLANVRDMVREEWLALDERYKATVAAVRDEQHSNSAAKIPGIAESYCRNFYDMVNGGESSLGRLAGEAFYEDEDGQKISKSEKFFDWMTELIQEVTDSDTIKQARSHCELKSSDMKTADQAAATISAKKRALAKYEEAAKNAVSEHASIANALFPPAWSILSESKKSPETKQNIYNLLYNVHPLTARYICYSLISRLDEIIAEKEEDLGKIHLGDYATKEKKKDYDTKPGVQSAMEAITNVREMAYLPIVSSYMKKGKLHNIEVKFKQGVDAQRKNIDEYLEASLYVNVCKLLKGRLEMLSENYRIFFDSIAAKIRLNDARIAHLEKMQMPLGQLGVYCTKEAFEAIAAEFKNKNDGEMAIETKTAVFEQLYRVFDKEYASRGKVLTERQKEKNAQLKLAELGKIFETAVVNTVRTSVVKNGGGTVDMTIRQALEKEYELEMPENMTAEEYIQKRVEDAMRKAAPMLAVDTNAMAENTETVYLALHPDCADVQITADGLDAAPSAVATQHALVPHVSEATDNLTPTVLLNESYSIHEMVCFKARYKFAIEDLVKYKEGSATHKAYTERIARLGQEPMYTGNPDDGLTVVPPHLDRNWHEEAYLPSIYPARKAQDDRELCYAFIYGLGTDFFLRQKGDDIRDPETGAPLLGWYYPTLDGIDTPLKVRGNAVGTTYVELYRALPYLGKIKQHLLAEKANDSLAQGKKYPSMEEREAHLLENDFIVDLTQHTNNVSIEDKDAEGNLFDILLEMRGSMDPVEWKGLFDGLLKVLQTYCEDLYAFGTNTQNAVPAINRSVRTILDEMLRNSKVGDKAEESITDFGEKDLYKQYIRLRSAVFEG